MTDGTSAAVSSIRSRKSVSVASKSASQRSVLLGDDVEAGPDRGRPGDGPLEGLRHVVRVHVVQHAQPVIGQRERPARGQVGPDGGIKVAGRRDDRPARPADVTGVQDHRGYTAGQRLAVQQGLDLRLAGAVLAVGRPRLVLGDRHPQRRTVHPDGAAVDQQRPVRAQGVDELPRRGGGEADLVDDHIRPQRQDPCAERSLLVLGVTVDRHPADRTPFPARVVRIPGPAADRDHLMAAAHQPRHQIGANVPGRAGITRDGWPGGTAEISA